VVAADLSQLHGPVSGVVELPHRLHWQPNRRVNIDNPALLRWMYETVLVEAITPVELTTWLHGPTLVRLWPDLGPARSPAGVGGPAPTAARSPPARRRVTSEDFQAEVARLALVVAQLPGAI
jgi:hypothetical protein